MSDYLRLPVVGLKANLTDWFEREIAIGSNDYFAGLLMQKLRELSAERRRALCRCGKSVAVTPLGLYYTHNVGVSYQRCCWSKTRVDE